MASTAFLVRLLLVITITISFAARFVSSYADQKDLVCIPAEHGYFNTISNKMLLPAGTWSPWKVQEEVLTVIKKRMGDVTVEYFVDVCNKGSFDGSGATDGNDQPGTEIFFFAGCKSEDLEAEECRICVGKAADHIAANGPGAAGAQCVSENCCVRYETYKFC